MKRNLLKTLFAGLFLTMLVPMTASADIEINEANFPDANFRNWLLKQSYGQSGKITDEEIKNITTIHVTYEGISSLQGIEYFTALTELNCSSNQLTSLDVSYNTALTSLLCSSNQLTSLDVSYNTALTSLQCNSNRLTSLDMSHNTALTSLQCNSNRLTSLNVSRNTALTKLQCESNQLTSLDVPGCTALTSLDCESNRLTSLDVSKNTALTSLDCDYNQLTSLDVSKNTALTELYCESNRLTSLDVSKNTALTELHCQVNQLTSLDMSKNTALTRLYCLNNQLTSLDVSGCTVLRELDCCINQLTSLDVSDCTALRELDCRINQLTSLDVSDCTALTALRCFSNQLTSLDVSDCTALTALRCFSNQLTSLDVSHNTALERLHCYSNQLTSLDVSQNRSLQELMCNSNQLTSLDVSQNTALRYLDCSINQIKGTAMDALIESLPVKAEVRYRYLDIYNSGDDGNVCTRSQVAAIKAKDWIPEYYNGSEWIKYEGSDEPTSETISVGANGLATYCSPFDLNFGSDDLKAYIASGYDHRTGTVLLTRVKEVPAGTGIVVMGNEGTYDVDIAATQYCYVNMLKGTLAAQPVPTTEGGYTNYILMNGKFYMSSGNGNIAAFKAYLQVPTASSAAGARNVLDYVIDDNTATGINQTEAAQPHDGAVYNLNGQRVEHPRNGLYIKNGHKVVIK